MDSVCIEKTRNIYIYTHTPMLCIPLFLYFHFCFILGHSIYVYVQLHTSLILCHENMIFKTIVWGKNYFFSLSDNPTYICGLCYSYKLGSLSWIRELKMRNKSEGKIHKLIFKSKCKSKLAKLFWSKIADILIYKSL